MRIPVVSVVAALLVGALVAPAATAHASRRTEQASYTAGGVQGLVGLSAAGQEDLGAVRFAAGRERFVSVSVTDQSGRPVLGEVAQDYNGDGGPELSSSFCGSTTQPVAIRPGFETRVYVYAGTCEDGSVSAPTQGTVKAVFSRTP